MFNVRSVVNVRLLLTLNSQAELAINIHVTVVDVHAAVSDVQHNTTNTHTMVSDIHRNMLKSQEGADDRHPSVSDSRTLSPTKHALTAAQTQTRSAILTTNRFNTLHLNLAHPVNLLPRHRGPVSDVKSWSKRSLAWQKS